MGVYLHRSFHGNRVVVYLSMENGKITKETKSSEFTGRIGITPDQQISEGYGFTFQLSLLQVEDTDWYYCSWEYFNEDKTEEEILSSPGTAIIVREFDPEEQCKDAIWDLVFIALTVTAANVVFFLLIGAIIVRCKRFKKHFRPAQAVQPSRPNRPLPPCPQQRVHHCPYLITAADTLDFRGIL
ncbi:uncharacterized protein ABDE67_019266 isoform 2-T2 [Symphorus nematophorus]